MQLDFWKERWEAGQIGFHEDSVNPHLIQYVSELKIKKGDIVFVPLCGKSLDMRWLQEQGYGVVGIDAVSLAVSAFFSENNIQVEKQNRKGFEIWCSDQIFVYCGDFFKLNSKKMQGATAVYDRASLVALAPSHRPQYAKQLLSLFPSKVRILLITLSYPQHEMSGPPFAVEEQEVHELFGKELDIQCLQSQDVLAQYPRFREKGLTQLIESVYLLSRSEDRT